MPYAGEPVKTSGIYRSYHPNHREHDREHALIAGQSFPRCIQCRDVGYILTKAAPGVEEDADLKQKEKSNGKRSAAG